jgi:hypothetical protein
LDAEKIFELANKAYSEYVSQDIFQRPTRTYHLRWGLLTEETARRTFAPSPGFIAP